MYPRGLDKAEVSGIYVYIYVYMYIYIFEYMYVLKLRRIETEVWTEERASPF